MCTVVAARGSTPQAAGARMLLLGDGKTIGTLGGGCVEAEVRQQAIKLLHAGHSQAAHVQARPRLRLGRRSDLRRDDGHLRADAAPRDATAEPYRARSTRCGDGEPTRDRADVRRRRASRRCIVETIEPPAQAADRRRGARRAGAGGDRGALRVST